MSEISGSLKNLKPEKIGLWSKFNQHIHVLVIPKILDLKKSQCIGQQWPPHQNKTEQPRNASYGYLKVGSWGEYLDPRGERMAILRSETSSSRYFRGDLLLARRVPHSLLVFYIGLLQQISSQPNSSWCWIGTDPIYCENCSLTGQGIAAATRGMSLTQLIFSLFSSSWKEWDSLSQSTASWFGVYTC